MCSLDSNWEFVGLAESSCLLGLEPATGLSGLQLPQ